MRFLVGNFVYIGKKSREVIVSHMLESKLPELFVSIGVVFCMISGVFVASAVS